MTYKPVDERPTFKQGARVKWRHDLKDFHGTIEKVYTSHVEADINGETQTRDASVDNPAYLINNESGGKTLKSHEEVFAM
eukprot:m.5929 g.5929  ORF g.5929 m.5929 type:complete len:80 (+) comp8066_c0_seq1:403-642(+)